MIVEVQCLLDQPIVRKKRLSHVVSIPQPVYKIKIGQ